MRVRLYPALVPRLAPIAVISCLSLLPALPAAAAPTPSPSPSARPDLVRGLQWQIGHLKLDQVHGRATGAGIVVAVVDSGVDHGHPDLTGQILQGPDSRANADVDGRGTGLAGLIAGHGHSTASPPVSLVDPGDAGILGVAPSAKILPVAFAPAAGAAGDADALASGVELAVNRGVRIICIGRGVVPSERLQFAIGVAVDKGVLVIASETSAWPASYPGVLGAIPADPSGTVRVPPVTGRTTGIAVPGVDLMTTDRGGGYRFAGVGAEAAILAGAAAVVWSADPRASADEIIEVLRDTASDRGAVGPDGRYGAGALDLLGALDEAARRSTSSESPAPSATPSRSPAAVAVATSLIGSGDWRRWLVTLPLLLFLAVLAFWAYTAARRTREA